MTIHALGSDTGNMVDLFLAIIVVSLATIVAFIAARAATKRLGRSTLLLILLAISAGLAYYLRVGQDQTWVARFIPFSNAIILGNFAPIIAALLAGTAYNAIPGSWWRKAFVPLLVMLVACWAAWRPVFAVQPPDGARLVNGVWRQTDQASCAPAAAATFLNAYGIEATQAEMAKLCLTSHQGTATLGLYRGWC